MIKSILTKTKKSLKPSFGYKELFNKESYEPKPNAKVDVISESEYHKRYATMSFCAWVSLLCAVGALVQTGGASDIIGVLICVLAGTLFLMLYFSYIYKLWIARHMYNKMFKDQEIGALSIARFVDEASVNPSNILPIKIKRKAGHG